VGRAGRWSSDQCHVRPSARADAVQTGREEIPDHSGVGEWVLTFTVGNDWQTQRRPTSRSAIRLPETVHRDQVA
jgi:hypothetical protein